MKAKQAGIDDQRDKHTNVQPQASTSKHAAEGAQMRWNKHEQGQERGERSQQQQA